MYKIYKQNNDIQAYVAELVADTEAEIADLPTSFHPGSLCLATDTGKVYVLNASKQWVLLG